MYVPLVPCPACGRHVRYDERACPFCADALPNDLGRKVIPPARRRLGRGAAFFFASTLAAAGCSSTADQPTPSDSGVVDADGADVPMVKYGMPDSLLGDSIEDVDGADVPMVKYGVPDTSVDDTGSPGTDYGMPPDVGTDGMKYGMPPSDTGAG